MRQGSANDKPATGEPGAEAPATHAPATNLPGPNPSGTAASGTTAPGTTTTGTTTTGTADQGIHDPAAAGAVGPTRFLADYVVSSRWQDLPADVILEAKRSFLNWLGVAIGASGHPTVDIALGIADAFGGPQQASVLGRTRRTDALNAAFVNGISSHVFDFDDTHLRTIIHPSGPVAAAALALAEKDSATGRALLHALVLGIEVECRIGNAVYPEHYDVGWHITATAGVFGAAAAASRMLGLDAHRAVQALGLAATQASGLREMFGTMTKPFHVGKAAQNGLVSALLAKDGFTSSMTGLEAPRGFANVLSTRRDYGEIVDVPADSFQVLDNSYKPFACGIVIHPSIDACIQLAEAHELRPEDIEAVRLQVHPLVLELTGKTAPRTGLEGKFSVYHSAAVGILDRAAAEPQYSDARVNDTEVVALRQKVEAMATPGIREDEVIAEVRLRDGTTHQVHVEHAIGSVGNPMSNEQLERKFRSLVEPVLSAERTDALIEACWELDRLPDVSRVIAAATPA